jgi:hypothetical protein
MSAAAIMLSALVIVNLILLEFVFSNWLVVLVYILIGSICCIIGVTKAQRIDEWKLFLIRALIIAASIFAKFQVFI